MKEFLMEHGAVLISGGLIPLIWFVVRLTPSKKDDVIMKALIAIFQAGKGALDVLVPDRKKGGGKHSTKS